MKLTNTLALCFARGHQGGTAAEIAHELGVPTDTIIQADYVKMGELMRKAQQLHFNEVADQRVELTNALRDITQAFPARDHAAYQQAVVLLGRWGIRV